MSDSHAPKVYAASQASTLTNWLGAVTIEQRSVGELRVPTGKIVACDPFIIHDAEPFELAVPAGSYPVLLSIIQRAENGDQRVATAVLQFTKESPTNWQCATLYGQNPASLKPGEIFCYGVDAGTGSFMDVEAARLLVRNFDKNEAYVNELTAPLDQVYVHTRSWANVMLDSITGLNCVLFSSGFGDGCYASYWGYDAKGRLACLMTDFGLRIAPS